MLTNWLQYYQLAHGAVLYRGLEMAQQGRMLTVTAMYYRYTRDAATLLTHLRQIDGVAEMLLKRRARALSAYLLLTTDY